MTGSKRKNKNKAILYIAILFPLLLLLFSLCLGTLRVSLKEVLEILLARISGWPSDLLTTPAANIILNIRLPRVLLALLAGAAFSVSGASLQSLFRNPLVNEYILGVSFGAGFGGAASLVLFSRNFPPQVLAFACGLLAVVLVLVISEGARNTLVAVLLTGIIVSALFQALLSTLEFIASPYALQALFFWLLGSFSQATWPDLAWSAPLILVGLVFLLKLGWRINVLSLSDDEARSLGLAVKRERILIICLATLVTSAVVAIAGIIGWVGLIVPHAVRGLVGSDNRLVLPVSAGLGASLMLLADDLIRTLLPFEFPVGILTSLVGIPFFLYLISRARTSWS
ncbi:MAG: ABC transporter, permease component [Candidatus Saccharicenans subterraneus]|uniref:ABC transporter, permease component n=1 Tax=Candidatus Saccharicenans subterraneus TaxID=2508984 RepID=A0A3E2BMS5_9BACT|nr:MAG: ABC transporter, permease component [Candidatus Saccharicenans subterraneum]